MNETVVYIFNSIGWSTIGFFSGYYVSKLRKEVNELHEEINKRDAHDEQDRTDQDARGAADDRGSTVDRDRDPGDLG